MKKVENQNPLLNLRNRTNWCWDIEQDKIIIQELIETHMRERASPAH